ncbi:IS21 family transposase [Siminovitchia fortis]|uniref:IS21 family transposase n=1 Tax=Siminovitchia fortis TaxID=254758 RepID=A0A443IIK6_9BACI|nr:IS21 family transposase [Siminovitchia fortis]RWR04026.1 IS21 family transposase [Siminovitchia fortis]WHY80636.1 IS21 family transposase [Siminovitchia fortis]WHY80668.1 IS21 family transposase [Siminovitchia fortis]WHY81568.1 IS21 family transposase [Siminovitchia fortis]WHY82414.1 IS21 family transposase [Siminovitchia fortis]
MLAMSEINCIKLLRNQKSFSINKIANTLGINWRTAKKYADYDQVPQENVQKKSGMMYEEPWGEIVSDWLAEDEKLKRKSRRTNKKIFEELQNMGFPGSYRTVCYFIKDWREGKEKGDEDRDQNAERLHHPPAEAQVDFGMTEAVKDGKVIDVHCLLLTLPYSNAAYCVPLPSENQECFLYGLQTIFHQLGGVPRKVRIDNLKAAVIRPRGKNEEATFTEEFLQFAGFYGFEAQACNPRSGHEKGNVENKVGYLRYNFVTPAPVIQSFEHLGEILKECLTKDRERIHYEKGISIQELLDQEFPFLLALPDEEYSIFKKVTEKANKYGEITIDQAKIHIPKGYNFGQLHVVKYWDRFKVLSPYGEVLFTDYRPYMHKGRKIPWQSILKSWLQKPRVVTYSRYSPYLPGRIYEYIKIDNLAIRKQRLGWLARMLATHEMAEINEYFYDLLEEQADGSGEPDRHPYEVDWTKYDQLQPAHWERE